MHIEAMANYL